MRHELNKRHSKNISEMDVQCTLYTYQTKKLRRKQYEIENNI